MKVTTKDIIALLPFDSGFKKELEDGYSTANEDRKFEYEKILWAAYDALYEDRLAMKVEEKLEEVRQGKQNLSKDFYKDAKSQVNNDDLGEREEGVKSEELSGVRNKLQALIQG